MGVKKGFTQSQKKNSRKFLQGYACACSTLAKGWGKQDLAQKINPISI